VVKAQISIPGIPHTCEHIPEAPYHCPHPKCSPPKLIPPTPLHSLDLDLGQLHTNCTILQPTVHLMLPDQHWKLYWSGSHHFPGSSGRLVTELGRGEIGSKQENHGGQRCGAETWPRANSLVLKVFHKHT